MHAGEFLKKEQLLTKEGWTVWSDGSNSLKWAVIDASRSKFWFLKKCKAWWQRDDLSGQIPWKTVTSDQWKQMQILIPQKRAKPDGRGMIWWVKFLEVDFHQCSGVRRRYVEESLFDKKAQVEGKDVWHAGPVKSSSSCHRQLKCWNVKKGSSGRKKCLTCMPGRVLKSFHRYFNVSKAYKPSIYVVAFAGFRVK